MPGPRRHLAQLRVTEPCQERWERMLGDGRVRSCTACDKRVHNLSALTAQEAEALLARGGELCVRYTLDRDGSIMTATTPGSSQRRARPALATAAAALIASAGCSTEPATPAVAPQLSASLPSAPLGTPAPGVPVVSALEAQDCDGQPKSAAQAPAQTYEPPEVVGRIPMPRDPPLASDGLPMYLSHSALSAVITKSRSALLRCCERAAAAPPFERIRLLIAESGAVKRVTPDQGPLASCVRAVAKRWRFPRTHSESEVPLPIVCPADER